MPSLKSRVPRRVSTLSGVVIDGGIAGAVWAAAKWGIVMAQATAAARSCKSCVMVLSPVVTAFQPNVQRTSRIEGTLKARIAQFRHEPRRTRGRRGGFGR